jgi:hypothetical protein
MYDVFRVQVQTCQSQSVTQTTHDEVVCKLIVWKIGPFSLSLVIVWRPTKLPPSLGNERGEIEKKENLWRRSQAPSEFSHTYNGRHLDTWSLLSPFQSPGDLRVDNPNSHLPFRFVCSGRSRLHTIVPITDTRNSGRVRVRKCYLCCQIHLDRYRVLHSVNLESHTVVRFHKGSMVFIANFILKTSFLFHPNLCNF